MFSAEFQITDWLKSTSVVFADQKGLALLIPKFAIGCSSDPVSFPSRSYILFRKNVVLFFYSPFSM
jgi:hypothetical protein